MRQTVGITCCALLLVLGAAASAEPRTPTTEEWRPRGHRHELVWGLLRLPERVLGLAFAPLYPLLRVTEERRLDLRVYDLLTNDAGTLIVYPIIDVRGSEGVRGGAQLTHSSIFGGGERLDVSGWVRANLDVVLAASVAVPLPSYPGRALRLSLSHSRYSALPFYPVGGNSRPEDVQRLRLQATSVSVGASWRDPAVWWLSVGIETSLRREALSAPGPGSHAELAGSFPGLGLTLILPELHLALAADSRYRPGRPSRGWLVGLTSCCSATSREPA